MNKIKIIKTSDGSDTLLNPILNETYHSTNGAVQESEHIFISYGLKACKKKSLRILEVGFGTGLNCLLTLLELKNSPPIDVEYIAVEKYPVPDEILQKLNYSLSLDKQAVSLFKQIHQASWNDATAIPPFFSLLKEQTDFVEYRPNGEYDVIYFDAFSPNTQPEMWTEECFKTLYQHTAKGGILTTYCAKGVVRRTLQAVGYTVERLQGPPGKREVLRATK